MPATLLLLATALLLGQTPEPRSQAERSLADCWGFGLPSPSRYSGVIWVCPADVRHDPKWADNAAAPVPLTVDEAIAKSRTALSRVDGAETHWRLRAAGLTRIFEDRWVYDVEWEVPGSNKAIRNVVTLSGRVVDTISKAQ